MNKEREVRYLCPQCFKDLGIKLLKHPNVDFEPLRDVNLDGIIEEIEFKTRAFLDVSSKCDNCGYEGEFIEIDEGFVDILQYMNCDKGYTTVYCCEGHHDNDFPYFDASERAYRWVLAHMKKDSINS